MWSKFLGKNELRSGGKGAGRPRGNLNDDGWSNLDLLCWIHLPAEYVHSTHDRHTWYRGTEGQSASPTLAQTNVNTGYSELSGLTSLYLYLSNNNIRSSDRISSNSTKPKPHEMKSWDKFCQIVMVVVEIFSAVTLSVIFAVCLVISSLLCLLGKRTCKTSQELLNLPPAWFAWWWNCCF